MSSRHMSAEDVAGTFYSAFACSDIQQYFYESKYKVKEMQRREVEAAAP